MATYRVLDRWETCRHFKKLLGTRLVVPRYNDGEWNLMTGNKKGRHVSEGSNRIGKAATARIGRLLNEAIAEPGQQVGINVLKPHNKPGGAWERCQQYLAAQGGLRLYTANNWLIHDFKNDCELLPRFFCGHVLIVSGYAEVLADMLKDSRQVRCDCYETSTRGASAEYDVHWREVLKMIRYGQYDNVLFGCGPVGKVLLAGAVNQCKSNLIDIGALACVLPGKIGNWPTTWTRAVDLKKLRRQFLDRVKELNCRGR